MVDQKMAGKVIIMEESTIKEVRNVVFPAFQDSIEIGTPGKGGCIKVYGDFNDPETFEKKITEAIRLVRMAKDLMV
jgi:hypothetical protein